MSSPCSPTSCRLVFSDGEDECASPSQLDQSCPASSSTLLPSSPLIQTPPDLDSDSLNQPRSPTKNAGSRDYCKSPSISSEVQILFEAEETVDIESEDASAVSLGSHSARSCSSTSQESSPDACDNDCLATLDRRPKKEPQYYSLATPAQQLAFSQHLERLLLPVLENQNQDVTSASPDSALDARDSQTTSLYAADISATDVMSRSGSGSGSDHASASIAHPASPSALVSSPGRPDTPESTSQGILSPTPVAIAAKFIYVSVDELSDSSRYPNESDDCSSGSGTCSVDMSVVSATPNHLVCHPSKHVFPISSTPPTTNNVPMPAAPKKVAHQDMPPNLLRQPTTEPNTIVRKVSIVAERKPGDGFTRQGGYIHAQTQSTCLKRRRSAYSQVMPPQSGRRCARKLDRSSASPSLDTTNKPATAASRLLAKESASLRRAASLRAEADTTEAASSPRSHSIKTEPHSPASPTKDSRQVLDVLTVPHVATPRPAGNSLDSVVCVPTEPSTPPPKRRHKYRNVTPSDSPLPLIAPPPFELIPRAPYTTEDVSQARIVFLMEREEEARLSDGLRPTLHRSRSEVNDLAIRSDGNATSMSSQADECTLDLAASQDEDVGVSLGIAEPFRLNVVQWILDVLPPVFNSQPQLCKNLRAQLLDSPETSWHAAHIFARYFLRVGTSPSGSPVSERVDKTTEQGDQNGVVIEGEEALTWDIGVACIALAVKFHRDFLSPFYPVTANEFLILAPHTMEYDDLESAQRDLLSAMSYCIGSVTPAAYMDEFWKALPSLRSVVEAKGSWVLARAETWELLYDTLMDVAYLRYPVYLLTGCALVIGVVESVVIHMKANAAQKLRALASGTATRTKRREGECTCAQIQKKARRAVRHLEKDMRELLGVSEDLWNACMRWLETIEEN